MAVAPFGLGVLFYAKDKLSPAVARLSANYERFGKSLGMSDTKIRRIEGSMNRLMTSFNKFFISGTLMQMGMVIGQGWYNTAKNIMKTGSAMANSFADFEGIANKIKLASKGSQADMKKLKDNAYEVGIATMFSWTEAMEAQRLLLSKGFSLKQVLDNSNNSILKTTVYLSEMTGKQLSLADATNLLIGMRQRFNLTSNAEVKTVANQLAAVQTMGAEAKDLRSYFQSMGVIPSQMGATATELIAFLPLLKKFDISARQAGFSVSSFYQDLFMIQKRGNIYKTRKDLAQKELKTPALVQLFDKLGIQLFDKNGNNLPALSIIGQFMDRMAGKTPKQVSEILSVLNKRGQNFLGMMVRVQAELKNGGTVKGMEAILETMRKLDPQNKELQGTLEKYSAVQRKSTKGVIDYYESVMDSLKVLFGESAAEIKTNILRGIAEPLEKLGNVLKGTNIPRYLVYIAASLTALVGSAGLFTMATFGIGLFAQSLSMVKIFLVELIPLMTKFSRTLTSLNVASLIGAGGVAKSASAIKTAQISSGALSASMVAGGIMPNVISAMTGTGIKAGATTGVVSQEALLGAMVGGGAIKRFSTNVNSSFVGKAKSMGGVFQGAGGRVMNGLNALLMFMGLPGFLPKGNGSSVMRSGKWNMGKFSGAKSMPSLASKVMATLNKTLWVTPPIIATILKLIVSLMGKLTLMGAVILTLYATWKTGFFGIKDALVSVWKGISKAVSISTAIMTGDFQKIQEVLTGVKKSGSDVYSSLGLALGNFMLKMKVFFEMMRGGKKDREHLTPKYDKMKSGFGDSFMGSMMYGASYNALKSFGIKTSIKESGYAIPDSLTKSFYASGGTKEDLMGMANLLDSLTSLKDSVNKLVQALFPNAKGGIMSSMDSVVKSITDLVTFLRDNIVPALTTISNALKGISDVITAITQSTAFKLWVATTFKYNPAQLSAKAGDKILSGIGLRYNSTVNEVTDLLTNIMGVDKPKINKSLDPTAMIYPNIQKDVQNTGTKFGAGVQYKDDSKQTVNINAQGMMIQEAVNMIKRVVKQELNNANRVQQLAIQQLQTGNNMMQNAFSHNFGGSH